MFDDEYSLGATERLLQEDWGWSTFDTELSRTYIGRNGKSRTIVVGVADVCCVC